MWENPDFHLEKIMKLLEIPTFSEKQSGLQRFLGESCINSAANKNRPPVLCATDGRRKKRLINQSFSLLSLRSPPHGSKAI